jgi:hypothetical protein
MQWFCTIAVTLFKKNDSMSCKQITTGIESFSFVKIYKSNITGTGLNGYQFFLQGHETINSDMCGTTIISHH